MGFTLTTPPSTEPVSVLEASEHLRVDASNAGAPPADVIITVVAPGALTDETVVPVTPLTIALAAGDLLKFDTSKVVVLAEAAEIDDEEIVVEELPFDLDAGAAAIVPGLDGGLSHLIAAARHQAERYTGAGIVEQVWTATFDRFPSDSSVLTLPRGPVMSIDAIRFIDVDGSEQTIVDDPEADPPTTDLSDLAVLDQSTLSAKVSLVNGAAWPATASRAGAVAIVFTVGYGTGPTDVPADLKAAILLRVGDLYRNREANGGPLEKNETVCALLDPHVRTALD